MLILSCSAQLQRLEGVLRRSLPLTLPVYGAVMNINRGNPADYEVVVDSWPDFGALLARRRGEVASGDTGRGTGWAWLHPGVRVAPLSPAHVDLLNETWRYGGNSRSRDYLRELLGQLPNLCLQDGTGQPLSWVLTDQFGTGTHGYTLPEHRRRGYMQAALATAARRAHARGFPTFG
ncbi:GLYL3 protein, partial [Halcyon senegalensis]|nr:GLYL3 protein [Halcyon senegalensis]